ncbi:hypothetical protein BD311DRAFT_782216 [Dichomitus squalens]|uniref:Uncharacterized protein n=1 Tax=Dichomitus squalens TaxID=114155 RepID=A0A4Q9M8Y8_9APHY|nr:hypothetical protein BD311DRAFT_782216 [Dichomitus squalens]
MALPPSLEGCNTEKEPVPFASDYYGDYPDDFFANTPPESPKNLYYPFASKRDWEVARWVKLHGPGLTALDELLGIEELNKIVDEQLPPARPRFERHKIIVAGEAFDVYLHDVLACMESLFSDPDFAPLLLLMTRVYFDMNTGKWWWSTQKQLERDRPGATIVPVIISSDKTQLTTFGNKTAYPVYMMIGNLPKDVCSKPSCGGQILLAYLPTSCLLHIKNKAACHPPLASAGVDGMELVSGDGLIRRGHQILATYVGDYPQQVLVTGCKIDECPKYTVPRSAVGATPEPSRPLHDLRKVLDTLAALDEGLRIKGPPSAILARPPVYQYLPHYHPRCSSSAPSGVIKHLLAWMQEAYGTEEINAHCCQMPLNNSLQHFASGISHMSRVMGKEHQDISRILLGLIIGLPLPGGLLPVHLVRATRALLDFLYLAQYLTHTTQTLDLLKQHLQAFHENKTVFLFGTTDNYDMQYSEWLHIDFTKDVYHATNKKDELAQMTIWLKCKGEILRHEKYIQWRLQQLPSDWMSADIPQIPAPVELPDSGLGLPPAHIHMLRHASLKGVPFERIKTEYGTSFFCDALARFVVKFSNPEFSPQQVKYESARIFFSFCSLPVYHRVKLWIADPDGLEDPGTLTCDVVHAHAARTTRRGTYMPSRFDTALIHVHPTVVSDAQQVEEGLAHCYRAVQVRGVFKIPEHGLLDLFLQVPPERRPQHLAYVELFTDLDMKEADHGMYKISSALNAQGECLAMIVPVKDFKRSCHLFPHFGPIAPREWTCSNVLDTCTTFYVNSFADRNTYKLVY